MLMIVAALLLSSAPASVARSSKVIRATVVVHAYFQHTGFNLSICALPIFGPYVKADGVFAAPVSCPSSTATVDVTEGQSLVFTTQLYMKLNTVTSLPHVVTAADIAAGSIVLICPI